MPFRIDPIAVGLVIGALFLYYLLKRSIFRNGAAPSLAFSRVDDLKFPNWRSKLESAPQYLHVAALLFFISAFIDPHILLPKSTYPQFKQRAVHEIPTEGLAIYLALDRSGSMAEPVETREGTSKMQLLKEVTKQFILDHPDDLMGIAAFARVPRILVPLTLDQAALQQQLDHLQVVQDQNYDGTAIGYAIFKTVNLIAATRHFNHDLRQGGNPPFTIKSALVIVITDGFQDPNRLDYGNRLRTLELDDAAALAKSKNIRLYVIGIDPEMGKSQFAPQRRQLQAFTQLTGGKFYLTERGNDLKSIYADISQLEKGKITREVRTKQPNGYTRISLYPYLIAIGMFCLFSALFLETVVLKKVP